MDEKDFRKHLADLAHGHHHTGEHDWDEKNTVKVAGKATKRAPAKGMAAVKSTAKKKTRKSKSN